MADRVFVYVDGESHFIRSENAWRKLHGSEANLDELRHNGQPDDRMILVDARAKVFWTRKMNPGVDRAYYFTSFAGDKPGLHNTKVNLREFDLEPCVTHERRELADQRRHSLQTQHLIEKAKGVDIALAVRMLEDAQREAFDVCHLYTSDIDFLPLITAVRGKGMRVYVHGYKDGLTNESEFLHECDKFFELAEMLRNECYWLR